MSPGPLPSYWLDVEKREVELTPELIAEPEVFELARLVRARLGDKAWEEVHRWFWRSAVALDEIV